MQGKLTRFRIEGLHNIRTIDMSITDNKLVLVGENGIGKSTVANFIYFFLTMQWSRMLDYKFKSVSAEIDSINYNLSRDDVNKLARKQNFINERYGRRLPISIYNKVKELVERKYNDNKIMGLISDEFGVPRTILRREIENIRFSNSISKELKKDIESVKTKIGNKVIYLPTYRRIEQDLEIILPKLEIGIRDFEEYPKRRKNTGYTELVEFGMEDVEETIHRKMIEIKETIRKDLSALTGDYLRDVIKGAYQSIDIAKFNEVNEFLIADIFKRIPEDILPQEDQELLNKIISEINESKTINDNNKVIAHFLTKLAKLYQKQQNDERDIREFIEICNKGYLSDKRFIYDDQNFNIVIRDILIKSGVLELPLKALSSGEKQIVSLFSHLYLSGKSGFFLIIDEPELSLSVPWQKQFLPDILKRCNGLIAVTHSPFIYDNELRPYAHSLEEFIKPYEYDPDLEEWDETAII
ncbi:MAG: ATP-binding protein [Deltaproteobacteria bacterium]|nr:ATP-binding protein [Deltaproteobacteria bacterium]